MSLNFGLKIGPRLVTKMICPWQPWVVQVLGAQGLRWDSGPASQASRPLGCLHLNRNLKSRIGPAG